VLDSVDVLLMSNTDSLFHRRTYSLKIAWAHL